MSFWLDSGVTSPTRDKSRSDSYAGSPEAEVRLLLLIDAFSRVRGGAPRTLEGRVKLAKLDFFVRYPKYLEALLKARNISDPLTETALSDNNPIEQRMIRYRYGPWDHAYYSVLGSLIGRGLVDVVPDRKGLGFRTTEAGQSLAAELAMDDAWKTVHQRIRLVRRHLDNTGTTLKKWIYETFPEIADADWKAPIK